MDPWKVHPSQKKMGYIYTMWYYLAVKINDNRKFDVKLIELLKNIWR